MQRLCKEPQCPRRLHCRPPDGNLDPHTLYVPPPQYFGHLVTKRKLDEDDEFEDHVNLNSVRWLVVVVAIVVVVVAAAAVAAAAACCFECAFVGFSSA